MLNRKLGPLITNDFDLRINNVRQSVLSNGMELYELNTGSQNIVRVELVFRTGRVQEKKPAVAKAAIKLLKDGSLRRSSDETAEIFDFYGAVFKADCNMEYAATSILSLSDHFDKVWPEWLDAVTQPAYAQADLDKYKELSARRLRDQLSKNDVVGYRQFTEYLFGEQHPYGYNTQPEHILALSREDLLDYFRANCHAGNAFVSISGQYSDEIRERIIQDLSVLPFGKSSQDISFPQINPPHDVHRIPSENVLQTNIKTGQLWVPRVHKDHTGLMVLNTVFGGYFGSRLMKNIREEKGMTYGIYSSFDAFTKAGYFYISSDVSSENTERTLDEVSLEIRKIKNEYIDEAELKMVKNYLLGQTLNLIDGPFATAQLIKSLRARKLDLGHFEQSVEELKSTDANQLIDLANAYLDQDTFLTVTVGKT